MSDTLGFGAFVAFGVAFWFGIIGITSALKGGGLVAYFPMVVFALVACFLTYMAVKSAQKK